MRFPPAALIQDRFERKMCIFFSIHYPPAVSPEFQHLIEKKCYFPAMSLEVSCYKYPAINTKFHITYKQWPTVIPYH